MSVLTTKTRFKEYAGITGTSQDALITTLITQVSGAIERYLRRTLEATTYKVWLNGTGTPILRLEQYPILAIYQVSIRADSVGYVENTSATVKRAIVAFDGTNVVLTEISTTGTETKNELPIATSKIMSTLQSAVAAKAGWALILNSSDYEGEPTGHLRPIYGTDALSPNTADLHLAIDPDPVRVIKEDAIELVDPSTFPVNADWPQTIPRNMGYGFPAGTGNIFVWYKAGYTLPTDADGEVAASDGTLPPGLALIVHEIIQDVLSSTKFNSNVQSESIGGYSYSLRATDKGAVASAVENRKKDLNQYRRVAI